MKLTRSGLAVPGTQLSRLRSTPSKRAGLLPQLSSAASLASATDRRNRPIWRRLEVYDAMVLVGVVCYSIDSLTSIHVDRKLILLLPFLAVTMTLLRPNSLQDLDRTRLPVGFLCYLGWTALSLLWTDNPSTSFSAVAEYLLASVAGIALACALTQAQMIRVFALSTKFFVVLSIATFLVAPHYATEAAASNAPGFRGLFGNKNAFGFLMASGLLALLFERPVTRRNKVWLALTAALLVASEGGTSWVGLLAVLAILAWLHLWRGRTRGESRLLFASWTVLLLGGAALITATDFPFLTHLIGKSSGLTGRTRIWNAVISAIGTRPIEGYGFGGMWLAGTGETARIWAILGFQAYEAHDIWLDLLLQVGIVGLVLMCGALAFALARCLGGVLRGELEASWAVATLLFFMIGGIAESDLFVAPLVIAALITFTLQSAVPRRDLLVGRASLRRLRAATSTS